MALRKPSKKSAPSPETLVEKEEAKTSVKEPEVEVVETTAEAEAKAPAVQQTQAPAVSRAGSNAIAPHVGSVEQQLAEEGFEGMEVGYHSFITIKLPADGIFETSEDDQIGKSFICNLISSKAKFAYFPDTDDDDDDSCIYSYDGITTTSGDSVEEAIAEWKEEGFKVSKKKYVDVQADVLSGDLEGETVMLSVAPASVQKLTGYLGKLRRKGYALQDTVTEVYAMDKVKLKNGNSFYPWGFRLAEQ